MGVKTGLLVTAIGLAIALHAYRKNKKQQQSIQAAPQQPSQHSWGKPAAAALGVAGAAYAGHHYLGNNSSSSPAPAPVSNNNTARPTLRDPAAIYHHLVECCVQKKLDQFYPPHSPLRLRQIAEGIAASGSLEHLANEWDLPDPFALDLVRLALFDIILLVDDSSSMRGGNNLREMRDICSEIAFAASLFDPNGIEVNFFNSNDKGVNVTNPAAVEALLNRNPPNGRTPMGRSLRDKILRPMTLRQAQQGTLQKPHLVMIFTDGASTDSHNDTPPRAISQVCDELQRTRYGSNCVFFSFSQVGDDAGAIQYLSDLDEDPYIGGRIDVTSSVRYEMKQVMEALKKDMKGIPPHLQALVRENSSPNSPMWQTLFRVKRLVGAVHPWYDQSDETGNKQKKRFSWSSSREIDYKPHWSEDPDYITKSTSALQARGFEPYPVPAAQSTPQAPSFPNASVSPAWPQATSASPAPPPQSFNQQPSFDQQMPGYPPSGPPPPQNDYYATAHRPPSSFQAPTQPGWPQANSPYPPPNAGYPQPSNPPYYNDANQGYSPGYPQQQQPQGYYNNPYNPPNGGGFVGGFGGM